MLHKETIKLVAGIHHRQKVILVHFVWSPEIKAKVKESTVPPNVSLPEEHLEKLEQKRYSKNTVSIYTSYMKAFITAFRHKEIKTLSSSDVNRYLCAPCMSSAHTQYKTLGVHWFAGVWFSLQLFPTVDKNAARKPNRFISSPVYDKTTKNETKPKNLLFTQTRCFYN